MIGGLETEYGVLELVQQLPCPLTQSIVRESGPIVVDDRLGVLDQECADITRLLLAKAEQIVVDVRDGQRLVLNRRLDSFELEDDVSKLGSKARGKDSETCVAGTGRARSGHWAASGVLVRGFVAPVPGERSSARRRVSGPRARARLPPRSSGFPLPGSGDDSPSRDPGR